MRSEPEQRIVGSAEVVLQGAELEPAFSGDGTHGQGPVAFARDQVDRRLQALALAIREGRLFVIAVDLSHDRLKHVN